MPFKRLPHARSLGRSTKGVTSRALTGHDLVSFRGKYTACIIILDYSQWFLQIISSLAQFDLNLKGEMGSTAFMHASANERTECMEILVSNKTTYLQ